MHSTTVAHPQTVSLGFRSFGDCEALLFFWKSGNILKWEAICVKKEQMEVSNLLKYIKCSEKLQKISENKEVA